VSQPSITTTRSTTPRPRRRAVAGSRAADANRSPLPQMGFGVSTFGRRFARHDLER
jgi:hypothetical protein